MLKANVRLYGPTSVVHDGVALTVEHDFPGITNADPGPLDDTIYAYFDLDRTDGEQSSSLDVWGTLDDFRALVANIQTFIAENEAEPTP